MINKQLKNKGFDADKRITTTLFSMFLLSTKKSGLTHC